jgi:hypothetical protein
MLTIHKAQAKRARTRKGKGKSKVPGSMVQPKGFFRLHIVEDGLVVGDSGWCENLVTDLGVSHYLVDLLGVGASSKQIGRMMLGTGTAPGAAATTLPGELNTATYTRTTVTFANVASKTARFTATWASANSHILAATTLNNIGIINTALTGGTLMAGNTYTTSQWNTNQDINATYEIRFATS